MRELQPKWATSEFIESLRKALDFPRICTLVVVLCVLWNWQFVLPQAQVGLMQTPDVGPLIEGFQATPRLWPDSLQWWHGPWHYPNTPRFRPLSAYLYWCECWIGLRYGWVWAGVINFALFVACCLTTAKISQRFTCSLWAALCAGSLAAAIRFFNSGDAFWLIWFPNAYNLLTATLWLNALLAFDIWHEGHEKQRNGRWLVAAWFFFVAACLSLESAWVFPAMALLIALLRPTVQARWQSLLQGLFMCFAVGFLMWYRARVIPGAELPGSNSMNFGSVFFYAHPLVTAVLLEDWAFLSLCSFVGLLCISRIRQKFKQRMGRIAGPVVWSGIAAIIVAGLLILCPPFLFFAYRLAHDPLGHAVQMLTILALPLGLFLLYRYGRATGFTWLVTLCLPPLAFLPTLPYMRAHWHYTVAPWFFLCLFYGMMAHLLALHWKSSTPAHSVGE